MYVGPCCPDAEIRYLYCERDNIYMRTPVMSRCSINVDSVLEVAASVERSLAVIKFHAMVDLAQRCYL